MDFEGCFRNLDAGDYHHARAVHDAAPPSPGPHEACENALIECLGGSIVMADVADFTATFLAYTPDVVVTLCSKPCRIPEGHVGTWHLFDINGLHTSSRYAPCYAEVVDCIQGHLNQHRTVLIHCLEGRDRTGIVGLSLMMLARPSVAHDDIVREMVAARPKRNEDWVTRFGLLREGSEYHTTAKAVVEVLDRLES